MTSNVVAHSALRDTRVPCLPVEISTDVLRLASTDPQSALVLTVATKQTRAISGPIAYRTIFITSSPSANRLFQYVRTTRGADLARWVRQVVVSKCCEGRVAEIVAAIPRAMPSVGYVGIDITRVEVQERPYRLTRAVGASSPLPSDIILMGFDLGDSPPLPALQQIIHSAVKVNAVVKNLGSTYFLKPSDAIRQYGVELDVASITSGFELLNVFAYFKYILRRPLLEKLVVRPWQVVREAGLLKCLVRANDERIYIAYDAFRATDGSYRWEHATKWTDGAIPLSEALDADGLTPHGVLAAGIHMRRRTYGGGNAPRKQLATNSCRR